MRKQGGALLYAESPLVAKGHPRLAKVLVTAALPCANEELYIGRLRTFVTADIFVRMRRALGDDVLFICGTDEHCTSAALRASSEGVSTLEITTRYHDLDKQVLARAGINFDYFGRTTSRVHHETVQWFFARLQEKGAVESVQTEENYCRKDKRFLPDRYVNGKCGFCGYLGARGDGCENCGRMLDKQGLLEPVCALCGESTEKRPTWHWYLRLEDFHDRIKERISTSEPMLPVYGQEFLLKQFLSASLENFSISRDLEWGVPVPLAGAEGKVFSDWFDALIGYVSFAKEAVQGRSGASWEDYWKDPTSRIVHFIGKGFVYQHAIFWPAMLLGTELRLPNSIVASGHANLEGKRMSKSSGWTILAEDFLEQFDPDFLRYYLIGGASLSGDLDFKFKEFQERVNADLVDTLGSFVHRALRFVSDKFGGKVPTPTEFTPEDKEFIVRVADVKKRVIESIDSFEFTSGLQAIISLARDGNNYLTKSAPWNLLRSDTKRAETVIYVSVYLARALEILSAPYLPNFAEKTSVMLGASSQEGGYGALERELASGSVIGHPAPPYQKVTEQMISDMMLRMSARNREEVDISYFAKLDIRVATIVAAEKVTDAKKLLRLRVRMGKETKTIVSGIADQYTPADLVGKKIVVINNLKPSRFAGVVSQGMLLAAEAGGAVSILVPLNDIEDGARVH